MAQIDIEWLDDSSDCDTCGCSYAEGAVVKIDGEVTLDLTPSAHCFGGVNHDREDVFYRILQHLGHTVHTA